MSIIKLGMYMLIGLFLVLIIYFVISTPLEVFFDSLDDADVAEAEGEMTSFLPGIRTALSMAFAIAIASPVMIFIFQVFEREPDWRYFRRL